MRTLNDQKFTSSSSVLKVNAALAKLKASAALDVEQAGTVVYVLFTHTHMHTYSLDFRLNLR